MRHEQVDRAKHESEHGSAEKGEDGEAGETGGDAATVDGTATDAASALPRMTHGLKTIGAGGPQSVLEYFFEQSFISKRTFYPVEYKSAIDETLAWYRESLRPLVEKLIKALEETKSKGA